MNYQVYKFGGLVVFLMLGCFGCRTADIGTHDVSLKNVTIQGNLAISLYSTETDGRQDAGKVLEDIGNGSQLGVQP